MPGLAMASRTVGSPQIRNRGTVGGNLGAASPAGDAHPALLAVDAARQAILLADGTAGVARMVHAAAGRCTGLHFGTYDYTAALGIAGGYQGLDHPASDAAKSIMQLAAAEPGYGSVTARRTFCRSERGRRCMPGGRCTRGWSSGR